MRPSPLGPTGKLSPWRIRQAKGAASLAVVRELFLEYQRSLGIDLCFQSFDRELAGLPGKYSAPDGRLFLARQAGVVGGCVALRPLRRPTCELKRLYVRPRLRGRGLGRALTLAAVAAARKIGYRRMRLDTLASMKKAIALYESLGFRRITPYYHNPHRAAVFMELNLTSAPPRRAPRRPAVSAPRLSGS
jgi:putative acetyltransferase